MRLILFAEHRLLVLVVSSTLRGALHGLRLKFNGPRGKVPARQRYRAESMRDHASGLHAKLAEQSERHDETAEQRLPRQLAEQAECRAQSSQVKVLHKCRTCHSFKHGVQLATMLKETWDATVMACILCGIILVS